VSDQPDLNLEIDGVPVTLGERIVLPICQKRWWQFWKPRSRHGVYTVTHVGGADAQWEMKRE
jgi:hypothetical protein